MSHEVVNSRDRLCHRVKVPPEFFAAIAADFKNFMVRPECEDYRVGDWLLLREWDEGTQSYTGRTRRRRVGFILRAVHGVADGWVCLGFDQRSGIEDEYDDMHAKIGGLYASEQP